jgi:hypothetical protein
MAGKRSALAALVLACLPGASVACQLSLAGPVTQQPLTYSPFDAASATAQVSFTLQNADSKPCDGAFAFFASGALEAKAAGGVLSYRLTGSGGSIAQNAPNPPSTLPAGGGAAYFTVGARQTYTATAMLSVGEGQVVPPGTYAGTLQLGVYQSASGQYSRAPVTSAMLGVAIGVNSQMTVALAGGGRRTTLNFGDLTEGATRSVQLLAYANQGFRLIVSSDNAGVMKPTDAAAQAEGVWRVPYTIAINKSAPVSLAQQRTLALWPAATQKSGVAIPIDVQAGSIAGQRAGIYRDVITISIDAIP